MSIKTEAGKNQNQRRCKNFKKKKDFVTFYLQEKNIEMKFILEINDDK